MQLLAQGLVSQAELEDKLGGIIIGGPLAKLEKDYELVRKCRPMLAGPASRGVVRYELSDPGLRFWLRNADALRADLELGRLDVLKKHALKDFKQEAKTALREWFLRKFQQESGYKEIGGEWAPVSAGPTTEIDILGFPPRAKRVLVGSVALRPEDFAKEPFLEKVASLRKGSRKNMSSTPGSSPWATCSWILFRRHDLDHLTVGIRNDLLPDLRVPRLLQTVRNMH